MSYYYFQKNNASTVLAFGISATDTTMTVAAGTGIKFPPAAGNLAGGLAFYCTITEASTLGTNEIVKVIYKFDDVFTVIRQQQGTQAPPQGWPAGSIVSQLITAGDFNSFIQRDEYVGNITIPVGGIIYWPSSTILPPPQNYLLCNGASKLVSQYLDLWNVIGYMYGQGAGSFNLPNLQGKFIRGQNPQATGYDPNRLLGTTQADEFQSHLHACLKMLYQSATQNGGGNASISWAYSTDYKTGNTGSTAWSSTETRPYNIALDAYIKYV